MKTPCELCDEENYAEAVDGLKQLAEQGDVKTNINWDFRIRYMASIKMQFANHYAP